MPCAIAGGRGGRPAREQGPDEGSQQHRRDQKEQRSGTARFTAPARILDHALLWVDGNVQGAGRAVVDDSHRS
jgi:hypothetical protein